MLESKAITIVKMAIDLKRVEDEFNGKLVENLPVIRSQQKDIEYYVQVVTEQVKKLSGEEDEDDGRDSGRNGEGAKGTQRV